LKHQRIVVNLARILSTFVRAHRLGEILVGPVDVLFSKHDVVERSRSRQVTGKEAYLEATRRFYSTIVSFQVKELLLGGERACALTRYELQPPGGAPFASDVAELFTVKNGKIDSFAIYFDTAPYPKQPGAE
jgi:ketosteroid isomerase-like protein